MNWFNTVIAFFAGFGLSLFVVLGILNYLIENMMGMSLFQAFGMMRNMGGAMQMMQGDSFEDFE